MDTPKFSTPPNMTSFPVEVKTARRMGLGVFTTRDVKKGEILCFYDGIICESHIACTVSDKMGYDLEIGNSTSIAGFRSVLRPGGCGQLINDASNDVRCIDDEDTYEDAKYWRKINVDIDDDNCFYATKNIRRGRQLFFNYGRKYWSNNSWYDERFAELQKEQKNTALKMEDYVERWRQWRNECPYRMWSMWT